MLALRHHKRLAAGAAFVAAAPAAAMEEDDSWFDCRWIDSNRAVLDRDVHVEHLGPEANA